MNEDKRIYKINVENIPEDEIEDYLKEIARRFKEEPKDFKFPENWDIMRKYMNDE